MNKNNIETATETTTPTHGTVSTCFGPLLLTPGLYFCTVRVSYGLSDRYGVHMRHGSPGGAFWKNSPPIKSFATRAEANEFIDELAGRHNAHKAFLDEFYVR